MNREPLFKRLFEQGLFRRSSMYGFIFTPGQPSEASTCPREHERESAAFRGESRDDLRTPLPFAEEPLQQIRCAYLTTVQERELQRRKAFFDISIQALHSRNRVRSTLHIMKSTNKGLCWSSEVVQRFFLTAKLFFEGKDQRYFRVVVGIKALTTF